VLLDSNIIIYASQPAYSALRSFIRDNPVAVSAISIVEVLGYHGLSDDDRADFEAFFASARVLPVSDDVIGWGVRLRQQRRMTLGDALIAGTALAHDLTLVTRNTDDFAWVASLRLHNPIVAGDAT
jgi:predicted nucleic acid-binding protein